jgi:hypothetical protein
MGITSRTTCWSAQGHWLAGPALGAALLLAIPSALASQACDKPGSQRWPLKTSLVKTSSAGHPGVTVSLADLLALADPPDADELDHAEFAAKRAPPSSNSQNLDEGAIVDLEGYIHLVALEADGDYHIQMTASPSDGNDNLILDVPCGETDFVKSASLRKRFNDVRAFIRDKMLKGKAPIEKGNVRNSAPYVRFRGQLFYDASHFPDTPGGKHGTKAKTIWEIHPVVAMWFVQKP